MEADPDQCELDELKTKTPEEIEKVVLCATLFFFLNEIFGNISAVFSLKFLYIFVSFQLITKL